MFALALVLAACQPLTVSRRAGPVQATPLPTVVAAPPPAAAEPAPAAAEPAPLAAAAAEAPPTAPELPEGPVSVALLVPLSGPSADLGRALMNAAQMALFDVGTERLVLLPKDTGGTPDGAARAAAAALADGATLILGPLFSASAAAVAPLASASRVNVIAFTSDRKAARPGLFIMGFLLDQQVERLVGFATSRGVERFAVLAPAGNYGQTVVHELRRVTQAMGGDFVDFVFYPADAKAASEVVDIVRALTDYDVRREALEAQRRSLAESDDEVSRQALRRLEGLDTLGEVHFDAVLLPEGGARLLTIAPLLPFFDVEPAKVRLLGTAQWETAALTDEPALFGGWFAAPPPGPRAGFEARFADIYGRRPPRLATLAYDAVALAGALARLPGGADFSAEILTTEAGYRGLDGVFRFAADGTNERGFAVLEVTSKGVVTVGDAPKSFTGF